jgi:hypothetical protein
VAIAAILTTRHDAIFNPCLECGPPSNSATCQWQCKDRACEIEATRVLFSTNPILELLRSHYNPYIVDAPCSWSQIFRFLICLRLFSFHPLSFLRNTRSHHLLAVPTSGFFLFFLFLLLLLHTLQYGSYHRREAIMLWSAFLRDLDALHIPAKGRQVPLADPHLVASVHEDDSHTRINSLAFSPAVGRLSTWIYEPEQCLRQSEQRNRDKGTAVAGIETPSRYKSR